MKEIVLVRKVDEGDDQMMVTFNADTEGAEEAIRQLEALAGQIGKGLRFRLHELLREKNRQILGAEVDIRPDLTLKKLTKRSRRSVKNSLILQIEEQAQKILS